MKDLIKFCHKHNVYHLMYYNYSTIKPIDEYYFKKVLNGEVFCKYFFNYGFDWKLTKEGNKFWVIVSNNWSNYCRINNKTYLKLE